MSVFVKKAASIIEGCFVAYFALLPVAQAFAQLSVVIDDDMGAGA